MLPPTGTHRVFVFCFFFSPSKKQKQNKKKKTFLEQNIKQFANQFLFRNIPHTRRRRKKRKKKERCEIIKSKIRQ